MEKNSTHPNFILGIASIILLFIGIGLKANSYRSGDYVLIATAAIGGIHWIWSIIDVFSHQSFKSQSKKFWIILVIIIPAIGSLCYYSMSKTMKM